MSDRFYYLLAFKIATDLTVTIAAPAILATLIGLRLDSHYGTRPYLLLACLALSLGATIVVVWRKTKYYSELYRRGS